jgi:CubicO group peptidase (beta-lactamase class C family)
MSHLWRAAFVAGIVTLACAAEVHAQDVARMDALIQDRVASDAGFMGAVLVAQGNKVLLDRAYGFANLEWDVATVPATRFRIASVTKQFTAAAILLLEERGRLSLSDPISRHWPTAPTAWEQITIFHLLTHTSGLPEFASPAPDPGRAVGPVTPEQVVARFRQRPLDFAPGEKWSYSNSGYVVLGYLIERISGIAYAEFIRQNILVPLQMSDSGYDVQITITPRRASGYQRVGKELVNAPYADMSVPYAAGGLYSTTADLLKWTRGLFSGTLLSAASLEKMTTSRMGGYGFGIYVQTVGGRRFFYHGGGISGFSSALVYFPEGEITVAVLSNVNGGTTADTLASGLSRLVFD